MKRAMPWAVLVLGVSGSAILAWFMASGNAGGGDAIGWKGWLAFGLGAFFTLVVGCGLMALIFYSARSGHDERVAEIHPIDRSEESEL